MQAHYKKQLRMTGDWFLSDGGRTNTSQRILEGQEGQICIAEVWGDRMMVINTLRVEIIQNWSQNYPNVQILA